MSEVEGLIKDLKEGFIDKYALMKDLYYLIILCLCNFFLLFIIFFDKYQNFLLILDNSITLLDCGSDANFVNMLISKDLLESVGSVIDNNTDQKTLVFFFIPFFFLLFLFFFQIILL